MSNQWLSACSVNNSDEIGRPGSVPLPRKTCNRGTIACSVKGTLGVSDNGQIIVCVNINKFIFKHLWSITHDIGN